MGKSLSIMRQNLTNCHTWMEDDELVSLPQHHQSHLEALQLEPIIT